MIFLSFANLCAVYNKEQVNIISKVSSYYKTASTWIKELVVYTFSWSTTQKNDFSLKISSANVTKSQFPADLVILTEEILNWKLDPHHHMVHICQSH